MDAGKIDNVIIHERKKDDHEIGNIRIKSFFEIAIQNLIQSIQKIQTFLFI